MYRKGTAYFLRPREQRTTHWQLKQQKSSQFWGQKSQVNVSAGRLPSRGSRGGPSCLLQLLVLQMCLGLWLWLHPSSLFLHLRVLPLLFVFFPGPLIMQHSHWIQGLPGNLGWSLTKAPNYICRDPSSKCSHLLRFWWTVTPVQMLFLALPEVAISAQQPWQVTRRCLQVPRCPPWLPEQVLCHAVGSMKDSPTPGVSGGGSRRVFHPGSLPALHWDNRPRAKDLKLPRLIMFIAIKINFYYFL